MISTVPELLALAHGLTCQGPHRCWYCGAACGEDAPAKVYVKDSFTGRQSVAAPSSDWVCPGCVLALRESVDVSLIDGESRSGQMMRTYSWIITPAAAAAATKAHLNQLRALCLEPPIPPYAIVLSQSGQTHQLYRGVVNHARDYLTVTLEGEPIAYRPEALQRLFATTYRIAAACGKPVLLEWPLSFGSGMRVAARYRDGEDHLATWEAVGRTGLGRLAAWLTPKMEVCAHEYPSDRR